MNKLANDYDFLEISMVGTALLHFVYIFKKYLCVSHDTNIKYKKILQYAKNVGSFFLHIYSQTSD
jgi:hypothetical protein